MMISDCGLLFWATL